MNSPVYSQLLAAFDTFSQLVSTAAFQVNLFYSDLTGAPLCNPLMQSHARHRIVMFTQFIMVGSWLGHGWIMLG